MAAANEFWAGMRVLAIDEDRVSLKILELTLCLYNYDVTPVTDAKTALRALGKAKDPFDLVISEVHMPDTDGFKFLRHIAVKMGIPVIVEYTFGFDLVISEVHVLDTDSFKLLRHIAVEMGIPVIVLSSNEDTETVKKVLSFGACRYLAKPVCAEQLKNIWQHVLRRKNEARNHKSSGNANADQRVQSGIAEAEQGAKSTRKNSRRKKNYGDGSGENEENSSKKPRLRWTKELHGKFVEAINRLGTDEVIPTRIFDMMDVDYISIQSIGSHLQKYRTHLKKLSNPKDLAAEKWTSSYKNMSNPESFRHYLKHQIWPAESSNNPFTSQSIELRNDLDKRTLEDVFPPLPGANRKSKDSSKVLAGMILETNQGKASSHLDYYFENIPGEEMLEPVNQSPVQPPQLASHSSVLTNAPAFFQKENSPATNLVGALGGTSKFPYLVGNYNNSFWQASVSSKFPDILHKDGSSLGSSKAKANIPKINQLASFARTSSGQIQMVLNEPQNPMAAFIDNTTPVAGFNQQMAPFNIASNTSLQVEMLNGNFSPGSTSNMSLPSLHTGNSVTLTQMVNDLSNNSTLPNIEADSFVAPTQMLNGGNVVGALPVQEGTADQQALDFQLNDNNEFSMDDIFSMVDHQNSIEDDDLLKNFTEDDALVKNCTEDDALLKNSKEDDALLMNFTEDDALLQNFTEDDALLKNFTEDDALLKNFTELDAFLNGDWF